MLSRSQLAQFWQVLKPFQYWKTSAATHSEPHTAATRQPHGVIPETSIISKVIYNVSSTMLRPTIPNYTIPRDTAHLFWKLNANSCNQSFSHNVANKWSQLQTKLPTLWPKITLSQPLSGKGNKTTLNCSIQYDDWLANNRSYTH